MSNSNNISFVFTGDIGFDHYMDKKWEDPNFLDGEVLDFLHSADHVVVNVEGALSKGEKKVAPNGVLSLMHSMDPEVTTFLRKIGADVWNIANNHIMMPDRSEWRIHLWRPERIMPEQSVPE